MRICHVITRMILGGAQENTLLSVLGQHERGHDVTLLTGPTTGPEGTLMDEARGLGLNLVEIPPLVRALSPPNEVAAYRELRRRIRAIRPDVVHTHSSKAGVLGRLAAWHERVPFVVHTIHGLPFHPYQSRLAHGAYVAAERFAARRCHRLLAVAQAMVDQAVAAGVARGDQFEVVYSGMRVEPFLQAEALRTETRQRFGFSDDDIVIGKVARLFELKGHEYLLPAFARLAQNDPRLRLLLIGDGLLHDDLIAMAQRLGIADRVVFAGLLPVDEVPAALSAMDLVAHCSLREGLPRVLPQALLAGRTGVAFDVDGAREVFVHNQTGLLVRPRDVDGLTRALRDLIDDPVRRQAMVGRGRELCRERFDWRRMVEHLLAVYEKGLAGGYGPDAS